MADLTVTTSVDEGWGYAFVEPWLSRAPLIGRNLPRVTPDFQENGMQLNHLYNDQTLPASPDPEERIRNINQILSNPHQLQTIKKTLNLPKRIEEAKKAIPKNNQTVRDNYDYKQVGQQLYNLLQQSN